MNAPQLAMIIANYPATSPQIAVDAPIALISNLVVAAKTFAPSLIKIEKKSKN